MLYCGQNLSGRNIHTELRKQRCIKNIIFDLGGVMVDFDPKTYLVDRFCNAEVEEQVSQLTFESEEWKLLDGRAYHPL